MTEPVKALKPGLLLASPLGPMQTGTMAAPGPLVNSSIGVAGTIGLAPDDAIFTWTAHPFNWNAPDFQSIEFQMDFQTDGSGQFDDDRMGWVINGSTVDSRYIFGVQLDHSDGGIVTFWRSNIANDTRVQTPIASLPTLSANTWYRFWAEITKLSDTSARIDVELVQLDANGNPTGTPYTGTVPDTSAWSGGAPDIGYFSATTMWPVYKNHNAITGGADNVCYGVIGGTVIQYNLTANASGSGSGSVASNPAGISYSFPGAATGTAPFSSGTLVTLTATAGSGTVATWAGCDSTGGTPTAATCSVTMNSARTVAVTFVSGFTTATFQNGINSYTGTVDTHIMQSEATTGHGALDSLNWDTDDPSGTRAVQLRADSLRRHLRFRRRPNSSWSHHPIRDLAICCV